MDIKKSDTWFKLSNNYHAWLGEGKLKYWQFILDRVLTHYDKGNCEIHNANRKNVIVMVDGFAGGQGGLTDRLRGALSIYSLCKKNNWIFKFYFNFPFNLTEYLLPNSYDWIIEDQKICRNRNTVRPIAIYLMNVFFEEYLDKYILKREINGNKYYQQHIYTNAFFNKNEYPQLFKELFKPSIVLQHELNINEENIGRKYVSATFRFQELLGDLKEASECIVLSEAEQQTLINKCINELEAFIQKIPSEFKVLVTSDSITFLSYAKKIDRAYVIPGKVFHPQHLADGEKPFMKSFVDFYMLMNAEEIYLFRTGLMYKSGFPEFAALIGDKKFYYKEF